MEKKTRQKCFATDDATTTQRRRLKSFKCTNSGRERERKRERKRETLTHAIYSRETKIEQLVSLITDWEKDTNKLEND